MLRSRILRVGSRIFREIRSRILRGCSGKMARGSAVIDWGSSGLAYRLLAWNLCLREVARVSSMLSQILSGGVDARGGQCVLHVRAKEGVDFGKSGFDFSNLDVEELPWEACHVP